MVIVETRHAEVQVMFMGGEWWTKADTELHSSIEENLREVNRESEGLGEDSIKSHFEIYN